MKTDALTTPPLPDRHVPRLPVDRGELLKFLQTRLALRNPSEEYLNGVVRSIGEAGSLEGRFHGMTPVFRSIVLWLETARGVRTAKEEKDMWQRWAFRWKEGEQRHWLESGFQNEPEALESFARNAFAIIEQRIAEAQRGGYAPGDPREPGASCDGPGKRVLVCERAVCPRCLTQYVKAIAGEYLTEADRRLAGRGAYPYCHKPECCSARLISLDYVPEYKVIMPQ